ncbi:hypothetical protein NLG97_g4344 [Lecanicillium saksenae]|uniref:Uncharacterized protein n=1 Tax=Lecanicillium saksenae TaxID=468837 RepID=A0ACC1QYU9_9HYPO|nr:hypothetical protein NLG97_g4344 [Lecanicillium saksenae]
MRITIVPAGTKTSAATIRELLKKGPATVEVYAVYRNLAKVPAEFTAHENFHAVRGDVEDAASLDLAGSDAVMTSTPPMFDGDEDPFAMAEKVSINVKNAVEQAGGVKRLMLLSSLGAEFDKGVGEIRTNHIAEKVLRETNVPEILFVRCGYFIENWTMFSAETLKEAEPYFNSLITPLDFEMPMVAVKDIGSTFATGLTSKYTPPVKPYVFALHGPKEYSPNDVQAAFSNAMGKHIQMRAIEKDKLADFFSAILPPHLVDIWAEMSTSFLPGGVAAPGSEGLEDVNIVRGKTDLETAIKDALGADE